jgi:four helix bundle protein
MPKQTKIQSFTDLTAWKEGHLLVLAIYKITNTYPKDQLYSLVSQMQRCALSITSNIAEGFSRRTKKDKIQFYYMALGSTTELQNQLVLSRDLGYLNNKEFQQIAQKTIAVHKLINGLIKSATTHI